MAGLLAPGMVWCAGPSGTIPKRAEDCPGGEGGDGAGGSASAPPNYVGKPPEFLDDSGNIYKDEGGTIRNKRQDPGGGMPSANARMASPNYTGGGGMATNYDQYGRPTSSPALGGYQPSNFFTGGGSTGSMAFGGTPGVPSGVGYSGPVAGGSSASMVTGPGSSYNPALAGIAGQVGGLGVPTPGAMPRTLYDKYSNLLTDPAAISNDPAYQLMLEQALKASTRSLSAGRMSKSGNAAIQAANVATGSTGQYLKQLSDIYGAGAGMEAGRYGAEAGVQSQGFRDILSKYQLQGGLTGAAGVNPAGGVPGGTPAPGSAPVGGPANIQMQGQFGPYLAANPGYGMTARDIWGPNATPFQLQNTGYGR